MPLTDHPQVVILDARFTLDDEDWGQRAFAEGHIPAPSRRTWPCTWPGRSSPA
jgi:hypothetical protein